MSVSILPRTSHSLCQFPSVGPEFFTNTTKRTMDNEAAIFLVDFILSEIRQHYGDDDEAYVRISRKTLQQLVGDPARYYRVMNALVSGGLIERDGSWQEGNYSQGYRINRSWLSEYQWRLYPSAIRERLGKEKVSMRVWREPIHKAQAKNLRRLILPDEITEELSHGCRLWADSIRARGCEIYSLDERGRLYSTVTQVPKALRRHFLLKCSDKPLLDLDIKTAHPLLMCAWLKGGPEQNSKYLSHINTIMEHYPLCARGFAVSVERLTALVEQEDFYGFFVEKHLEHVGKPIDRQRVKKLWQMFQNSAVPDRDSPAISQIMRAEFPAIANVLDYVRAKVDGLALCNYLVEQEVQTVFGSLERARNAIQGLWFATIHDGILIEAPSRGLICDLILEAYRSRGVEARVETTFLANGVQYSGQSKQRID